jgi:hypothetical protein
MRLNPEQSKYLRYALIDAFPETISLERMLQDENLEDLREIVGAEGALQDIVFKLIKTADAQGWSFKLVCAAMKTVPGNEPLQIAAFKIIGIREFKKILFSCEFETQEVKRIITKVQRKIQLENKQPGLKKKGCGLWMWFLFIFLGFGLVVVVSLLF